MSEELKAAVEVSKAVEVSGTGQRSTDLPPDAPWWARWVVSNISEFWKWLSFWLTTIAASAPLLYENVSSIKEAVPEPMFHYIEAGLCVLIFLGRIKRQ